MNHLAIAIVRGIATMRSSAASFSNKEETEGGWRALEAVFDDGESYSRMAKAWRSRIRVYEAACRCRYRQLACRNFETLWSIIY